MIIRSLIGKAAVASLLALAGFATAQADTEEDRCRAMLDGQVAWDQSGNSDWQPENIEALCSGATDADARISCFEAGVASHNDWSRAIAECTANDGAAAEMPAEEPAQATAAEAETSSDEVARCRAMVDGQIAWSRNGDKEWMPENIEALCKGATNADARIACFESGIAAHDDWNRAIAECTENDSGVPASTPAEEPADASPQSEPTENPQSDIPPSNDESALCKKMFQGRIPMELPNGSKTWDADRLDRLCNGTVNAMETLKCYIEALGNGGGTPRTADAAIEICRTR